MGVRLLVLSPLLVIIPLLAAAETFKHVDHEHWSIDYDAYFRKYAKHYFGPLVDWRWFKAQGIAESGLNPNAHSPAGAKGIMQILPATYQEIKEKNPQFSYIDEPRWNIAAGIYYDRLMFQKWKDNLPTQERINFALASYNAGYANVRRAFGSAEQKLEKVRRWTQVAPYAPKETRRYVQRIARLMDAP